jgi:hypothetical protein
MGSLNRRVIIQACWDMNIRPYLKNKHLPSKYKALNWGFFHFLKKYELD